MIFLFLGWANDKYLYQFKGQLTNESIDLFGKCAKKNVN
jgi:hypothetical protein